jgi:hypothetical protein
MYNQFEHYKILHSAHTLPSYAFMYLRTNRKICSVQQSLIGFYNLDGKRLLRGTN